MYPDSITIQIDTREKCPILFPANIRVEDSTRAVNTRIIQVRQERIALNSGDYRIKEAPSLCAIERKAGQRELLKNLMDDRDLGRVARSLTRLVHSCSHPVLLLEASPHELLSSYTTAINPEILVNRLSRLLTYYKLHLLFTGRCESANGRRSLGLFLLHYMVGVTYTIPMTIKTDPVSPECTEPTRSID